MENVFSWIKHKTQKARIHIQIYLIKMLLIHVNIMQLFFSVIPHVHVLQ